RGPEGRRALFGSHHDSESHAGQYYFGAAYAARAGPGGEAGSQRSAGRREGRGRVSLRAWKECSPRNRTGGCDGAADQRDVPAADHLQIKVRGRVTLTHPRFDPPPNEPASRSETSWIEIFARCVNTSLP